MQRKKFLSAAALSPLALVEVEEEKKPVTSNPGLGTVFQDVTIRGNVYVNDIRCTTWFAGCVILGKVYDEDGDIILG